MKILKPFYYDYFQCIANKCIDSCCIGWKVDIDKKSYKKYKKLTGEFSKEINESISRNRSSNTDLQYGKMKLNNNRCKMLNEDNLCDLYVTLGENYLCNTCKMYPREINKYQEIYERNLSMSCPEVARYIVKMKEKFSFNIEEETLSDLDKAYIFNNKKDENLYNLLWESRILAMEVIQFKEIDLWKRIVFLKLIVDKVQNRIDESNYNNYLELLNILRSEITNVNVINSLDKIPSLLDIKLKFIQSILQAKNNQGSNNEKYSNLIEEYNALFEQVNTDENILDSIEKKEKEFNTYLKDKENILENLLIYLIYKYFMTALNTKDLNRATNKIIIIYTTIKALLLARYNKNNKELREEDFVEVFYIFSRVVEHNSVFLNELYKNIKEAGYDNINYVTILVR